MNGSTRYDYRRVSHFDGAAGVEGDYSDNATLSGRLVKDALIYKNSREMHTQGMDSHTRPILILMVNMKSIFLPLQVGQGLPFGLTRLKKE